MWWPYVCLRKGLDGDHCIEIERSVEVGEGFTWLPLLIAQFCLQPIWVDGEQDHIALGAVEALHDPRELCFGAEVDEALTLE